MAKKKDKPKPSSNGRLKDSDVKKFSQAKLTEYLQNKSYRLNDRWLTPDMLSTRRRAESAKAAKARDAAEVVPNSGLTFGRLKDQEKYSETLAFGGQDAELRRRGDQAKANEARDKQWFDAYQQKVAAARMNAQTTVNNAQTAGNAAVESSQANSVADNARVAQALRDRAAQLNLGGNDAGAQYQQVADQAGQQRTSDLQSQQEANRVRSQGTVENLRASEVGVGQQKTDALVQYRAKEADLSNVKLDLEGKKAAWRQDYMDKTLAAAQQRVQEQAVYAASLQKNSNDYKLELAKLKQLKAYQSGLLDIGMTNANANQTRANKTGNGGGSGGSSGGKKSKQPRASAANIQNFSKDLDKLFNSSGSYSIKRLQGIKGKKNYGAIRQTLLRKGLSSLAVDSAMDIIAFGKLSATNVRRLHAQGFKTADFPRLGKR